MAKENKENKENDFIEESEVKVSLDTDNNSSKENNNDLTNEALELERLTKENLEWKDKFQRLFAEFDNFRKRSAKENLEVRLSANKDLILEFLEILDDFDRAIDALNKSEDIDAVKSGINLIYEKMIKSFDKKNVKKIDSKGEPFNSETHEAITEIDAGPDMKGIIVDEILKGYTLNDKIIRHSKVVVGK